MQKKEKIRKIEKKEKRYNKNNLIEIFVETEKMLRVLGFSGNYSSIAFLTTPISENG